MNEDSINQVKEVVQLSMIDMLQFGTVDGKLDTSMLLTYIKGDTAYEVVLTRQEFLDLAGSYDKLIWGYTR